MSPSANERSFVLIANPGSRRAELFHAALGGLGLPSATLVPYAEFLQGKARLGDAVTPGSIVKVDSPGKDFAVEKLILERGASVRPMLDAAATRALQFRKGEILFPAQWFAGFSDVMGEIDASLAACPPHFLMNDLHSSVLMFDKPACQKFLREHAVPVPRQLGHVASYSELLERMVAARMPRVFVKLAYGSSASGVAAFQVSGERQQATTTVEMEDQDGELRLFNSRKIRTYTGAAEIRRLLGSLCAHGVHVEEWIPKAGIAGKTFDLRIVAVAGDPRFIVVRTSRHPITNLHLLNERGDVELVRNRMGEARWEEILETCRRVCGLFPRCLYVALDVLIRADWRAHAVLELNAFGDLLPGILNAGEDLYTAEIRLSLERCQVSPPMLSEP